MKRNVRLFAVVACALFAFVFMGAEKPKGEPIRAKIGVISIITGQGAAYGEAITNGIKLARDETNAKGEAFVDLKIEDSSGKQERALSAAQKLINSEKVIEIAKEAAEGLIVATSWFGENNDPKVKAFVAKYEKVYGKKPDQYAAQAYDAFYIMTNALKAAGKADRAKLFV